MKKSERMMLTKALRPLVANMVVQVLEGLASRLERPLQEEVRPRRRKKAVPVEEDEDDFEEEEDDDEFGLEGDLNVDQDEDGNMNVHHEDDEDEDEGGEGDEDEDDTEECGPGMRESVQPRRRKGRGVSVLEAENARLKRGNALRDLTERLGLRVSGPTLESLSALPPKKARAVLDDMAAAQGKPRRQAGGDQWVSQLLEGQNGGNTPSIADGADMLLQD